MSTNLYLIAKNTLLEMPRDEATLLLEEIVVQFENEDAIASREDEIELRKHWAFKLAEWREMTWWQRFRYIGFWVVIDTFFGLIGATCMPIGMVIGGSLSVMGGMFILGCYLLIVKYILLFFGIEGEEVMESLKALIEWTDTWKRD